MAGQGEVIDWPAEQIPNRDRLFMRVHKTWRKKDGSIAPGAFQNHSAGMSTDWEKYSTPEETHRRARRDPKKNAVVFLVVGEVRAVPGQRVEHTPDVERCNRAHTDVLGEKDVETRMKLTRIAEFALPFDV